MDMTVRAENIANMQGYEYHIEKADNIDQLQTKPTIHNEEHVQNVINQKINPLIFFKDELEKEELPNNTMIDAPFIIGLGWNNKELLDGFRKQKIKEQ